MTKWQYFPPQKNMLWHFLKIVFLGDNLHELSRVVFWKNKKYLKILHFLPTMLTVPIQISLCIPYQSLWGQLTYAKQTACYKEMTCYKQMAQCLDLTAQMHRLIPTFILWHIFPRCSWNDDVTLYMKTNNLYYFRSKRQLEISSRILKVTLTVSRHFLCHHQEAEPV